MDFYEALRKRYSKFVAVFIYTAYLFGCTSVLAIIVGLIAVLILLGLEVFIPFLVSRGQWFPISMFALFLILLFISWKDKE